MQSYCLSAKKHFVLLSRLNMPLHKCVNILLLLSKSSSYELFKGKLYPQVGLSKPPCLCACINLVSPILKRNYSSAPHTSQISTNFSLHSRSQTSLTNHLHALSENLLLLLMPFLIPSSVRALSLLTLKC